MTVIARPAQPDFSRQLRNPRLIEAALGDAETLLRRAVELAPNFLAARSNLATVLYRQTKTTEALAELDALLAIDPEHAGNANLKAAAMGRIGEYDEAVSLYEQVLARYPEQPKVWMSYGHVLKTVGRQADSIEAYRRADDTTRQVDRTIGIFTPGLFVARAGQGCPAPDPIFVIGMPRAGSTLIEQILASHSQVEGTMELPDIPALAARVAARKGGLDAFEPAELLAMGEEYLERTRIQRKTDKPYFIDKMPNNWAHLGLIQLILPNAKIVDARRHPLGCCFSNFKQHFARGQAFSYGLDDMGRYYADYVRYMAHIDAALPGRVHRVFYERMVEDSDTEIRALLAALGLPFEESCLRFYENDRAVRTASSEQVRRPIYREGTEQWQMFEPWLDPLKDALGPVLTAYPDVPAFN